MQPIQLSRNVSVAHNAIHISSAHVWRWSNRSDADRYSQRKTSSQMFQTRNLVASHGHSFNSWKCQTKPCNGNNNHQNISNSPNKKSVYLSICQFVYFFCPLLSLNPNNENRKKCHMFQTWFILFFICGMKQKLLFFRLSLFSFFWNLLSLCKNWTLLRFKYLHMSILSKTSNN